MEDYSIWQDMFDTLQSFPNWLKVVAMLIPAAVAVTISQQFFHYRTRRAELENAGAPPPPQWESVVPSLEVDLLAQELELPRLEVTMPEDRREE